MTAAAPGERSEMRLPATRTIAGYAVRPGLYRLNGANVVPGGVSFTIYSFYARSCELCLFRRGEEEPYAVLPFPESFRIGHTFSMIVFGLDVEEFEYAYRMDGPYDPKRGLRFDRTRYLLDPYARAVTGQSVWGCRQSPGQSYHARVVRENFDWGDFLGPKRPLQDLVIYEVHVRGFTRHPSSGVRCPGTFAGLREKIPYLKELGISCIYLNPIVEARSNHRYDTSDYHRPDPILGSMEDFEHLCAKAGELGIRLILDGVYSHTGADSRYFNRYGSYPGKGACQGKDSEYYRWYDFSKFPDEYRCWWGFKDLPEVDEQNPKWQEDIVTGENSVVKLWLRHGASGWRLDVADELPDDVLELIRGSVKAVKPDAPVIGEVWEDAIIKESYGSRRRYALGSSLDSVMNYPFRDAVLAFMHGYSDAHALCEFFISQQMNYPKPMYYALMNLLGSHDVERLRTALATNVWLRSLSREDQLKIYIGQEELERAAALQRLCAAIQFTIPGVPCIYYGDEQGMCGINDPFNRLPFREGDESIHDYYAALAQLRNSSPVLSTGQASFMAANKDVLLILRYINDGVDAFGEKAENGAYLVVINRGQQAYSYVADCQEALCGSYCGSIGPVNADIIKLK